MIVNTTDPFFSGGGGTTGVDDSPEWVEIEYEQNVVKCRKELGTLIEIDELVK